MREVEAEIVGRDQAALLRDVGAKVPAQRGVKQMGGAMIGADAIAAFDIDLLVDRFADCQLARDDLGAQHMELAERLGRVLNFTGEALEGRQFSAVADLATALAVEGRLVEQDLDRLADFGAIVARAVLDDGQDHALAFVTRIAGEFGRAIFLDEVEPDVVASLGARPFPGRAGLRLLLGHRGVEAGTIDLQPARPQRILGQVIGKTERVIELERGFARSVPPSASPAVASSSSLRPLASVWRKRVSSC